MPERDQHPGNRADEPRVPEGDAYQGLSSVSSSSALPWLRAGLLILFFAALIRHAWVSEDAHITLRTIDNFWHGYGLRWNVLERVQTFTHPLWMLLVGAAYGVTREAAFTSIAIGVACTIALLTLIVRTLSPLRACLAIGLLAASRAFVDFSTSGLENPLTHLLLAIFWVMTARADEAGHTPGPPRLTRLTRLTLLASLIALTRQDLLLFVAPAVIAEAWRLPWRRALPALVVGVLPLVAWHTFALIYYGFPFPNTAYAKLATGVSRQTLTAQGLGYFRASFESDPVTLLVIAAGVVAAVLHSRRRALVVGLPIVLYLVYIISIGGDFMNGRFLTPLVLYAVLTLAGTRWAARPRVVAAVVVSALALAIAMPESALRVWAQPPPLVMRYGVLNEQTSYYPFSGLIPMLRGSGPADHDWGRLGRSMAHFPHVTPHVSIGIFGYYAGPGVHIIDELGLGDPLLARMPSTYHYAPGHFQRTVPAWYKDFLDRCVARVFPHGAVGLPNGTCLPYQNELASMPESTPEAEAIQLYRNLLLVTQGPLWDSRRLWTILYLNLRLS